MIRKKLIIFSIILSFFAGTLVSSPTVDALAPWAEDVITRLGIVENQVTDLINGNIPAGSVDWANVQNVPPEVFESSGLSCANEYALKNAVPDFTLSESCVLELSISYSLLPSFDLTIDGYDWNTFPESFELHATITNTGGAIVQNGAMTLLYDSEGITPVEFDPECSAYVTETRLCSFENLAPGESLTYVSTLAGCEGLICDPGYQTFIILEPIIEGEPQNDFAVGITLLPSGFAG